MLRIRLTRVGKKNSPSFRVVVADQRRAVKRKFIEIIGHYNPAATPKQIVINKEKALEWIKKGAQPTDTVTNLMVGLEILPKEKKVTKIYAKKAENVEEKKEEVVEAVTDEATADEAPVEAATESATEVETPTETEETSTESTK